MHLCANLRGFAPVTGSTTALLLALLVGACTDDAPTPVRGRCATSRDCSGASMCVDGRCVAPTDAGGMDAGGDVDLGDAGGGGGPDLAGFDAAPPDLVCTGVEAMGTTVRLPIDVIVLPDESASMGPARDAVRDAMDTTFRTAMETAGIDYRVLWMGRTTLPMLTAAGRITNYPAVSLGSGNGAMFKPVLDIYDSWAPTLRADAIKVFVHFTDATSGTGAAITGYTGTFDQVLFARDAGLWGTAGAPRFSYNTFVGLTVNTPPEMPYLPADPLVSGSCSGSFTNPPTLQEIAQRTGGLRFPLCRFDLFNGVFQRIAESAIARAAVPCELVLPPPMGGMSIDESTVAVRYRTGSGGEEVLFRAASAAECSDTRFLLDGDRVTLCPTACARVTADADATLSVLSGCDPSLY